jgi:hypothetical protein
MKKLSYTLIASFCLATLFILPTESYGQVKLNKFIQKAEKFVTDVQTTTEKAQQLGTEVQTAKTQVGQLKTSLSKNEQSPPLFGGSKKSNGEVLSIKIQNTDYMGIMNLSEFFEDQKYVKELDYSFSNDSGLIEIIHSSKVNEILPDMIKNSGFEMKVVSVQKNAIEISLK